jgi:hypothetical protein
MWDQSSFFVFFSIATSIRLPKKPETRARRLAQAVEMLAAGRNLSSDNQTPQHVVWAMPGAYNPHPELLPEDADEVQDTRVSHSAAGRIRGAGRRAHRGHHF